MRLDNIELKKLLDEKKLNSVFHANSVATSITFIQNNGLLSRGAIEEKSLIQSAQSSDVIDKKFNVWNDIFVDSVDLHGYFPRQNFYGPILFKFSTEFLINEKYNIWVTKSNPTEWNDTMSDSDKYFESVSELRESWDLYLPYKKMITIRDIHEPVLFDHFEKIIIDDPEVNLEGMTLFRESLIGLKNSIGSSTFFKGKIEKRNCSNCFCKSNYLHKVKNTELKKLFLPATHSKYPN